MNIEIGTKLYRYVAMSGIWEYEVFGVRIYNNETQYEIRSKSCKHGWACELLIAHDDKGRLAYVSMLNNDEDDDQSYWHVNGNDWTFYFNTDKTVAQEEAYNYYISIVKKDIAKIEEQLKMRKLDLKRYQDLIAVGRGTMVKEDKK